MNRLFVSLTFVAVLCQPSWQNDQLYSQTFGPPYYPYDGQRGYYNNYFWPSFAMLHPRFYNYYHPKNSVTTAGTTTMMAGTTTTTEGKTTTTPGMAGTAATMAGTTTPAAGTTNTAAGTATGRSLSTESSTAGSAKDSVNVSPAEPLEPSIQRPMTFGYDPLLYMVPVQLQRSPSPPKKSKSDPNGMIYKGRFTRKSLVSLRSTSV